MKNEDIGVLVDAYIEHFSNTVVWEKDMVLQKRDNSATRWAVDQLFDITYESPERLWEVILEVLKRDPPEEALAVIAAGPVEDYLAKCGEQVINKVEQLAATNPKFKHLLGGVWRSSMSEDVWQRVQACRGETW